MRLMSVIALGVLLPLGLVRAADVPGHDANMFQEAVQAWLDNDDARSLPMLSELSNNGNAAAEMLLGLIDKSAELQGPWLSALPKDKRVALMRAPGGISGHSWMRVAAATTPLAADWVALWSVDAQPELALSFAQAGEKRAAREALLTLAARQREGIADIADDPAYPQALRFLAWRAWRHDPVMVTRVAAEQNALPAGSAQRLMTGETPEPAELSKWLMSAPEAAPVAAFCSDRCGATAPECARAALGALDGPMTLMTLGSPSETLIAPDRYDHSARGQSALLRRILLGWSARGQKTALRDIRTENACLADALTAENARYARN